MANEAKLLEPANAIIAFNCHLPQGMRVICLTGLGKNSERFRELVAALTVSRTRQLDGLRARDRLPSRLRLARPPAPMRRGIE